MITVVDTLIGGVALTFHFSISSCCRLYCLIKSSKTFLRPSELVSSAGLTSFTVLSTRIPLIMRKHLRSWGSGSSVSSTSLLKQRSGEFKRQSRSLEVEKRNRELSEGKRKMTRKRRTCVPRLLVQHRQSSEQVVGDCSCMWYIVVVALYQSSISSHLQGKGETTSSTCLVVSSELSVIAPLKTILELLNGLLRNNSNSIDSQNEAVLPFSNPFSYPDTRIRIIKHDKQKLKKAPKIVKILLAKAQSLPNHH